MKLTKKEQAVNNLVLAIKEVQKNGLFIEVSEDGLSIIDINLHKKEISRVEKRKSELKGIPFYKSPNFNPEDDIIQSNYEVKFIHL